MSSPIVVVVVVGWLMHVPVVSCHFISTLSQLGYGRRKSTVERIVMFWKLIDLQFENL
jgi:hypothetical protein